MQSTFFMRPLPVATEDWTNNIITTTGNNGSSSTNIINIWYRRSIMMWVYTAAEMQAAFGKSSATITGLRFSVVGQPQYQPLPNYAIGMKNGTFGSGSPGGTGYTVVKNEASESFTTGTTKTFSPLSNSFAWTGGDLAIIVAWGQSPVSYSGTGISPIGSGTMWYAWTDDSGTYTINSTTPTATVSYRPVIQLYG